MKSNTHNFDGTQLNITKPDQHLTRFSSTSSTNAARNKPESEKCAQIYLVSGNYSPQQLDEAVCILSFIIPLLDTIIYHTAGPCSVFLSIIITCSRSSARHGGEKNTGLVVKFDTDEESATVIKRRQGPASVSRCEIKLLQL